MAKYHEYYDLLNNGKKDYHGEINRILELYKSLRNTTKINSILEIGSGTGNHTLELAKLAPKISAVDIDREMIKIAKEKVASCESEIEFHTSVSQVCYHSFPLCVMMWHVLNYFPSLMVMESTFKQIYYKMEPGGCFFFDAWNGVAAIRDLPKTTKNKLEVDGLKIIHELNGSTSLMDQRTLILNKIEIYRDDKLIDKFSQEVTHYIWTPKTVREVLHKIGFVDIEVVKTTDYHTEANEDDWKIFFKARKKPTG